MRHALQAADTPSAEVSPRPQREHLLTIGFTEPAKDKALPLIMFIVQKTEGARIVCGEAAVLSM